jgi:hypothetical protein
MSDQLAAHNDVMLSFTVTASSPRSLARLGRLAAPRRPALPTPTFLAATSRGAIPHLTPDEQTARTAIAGVYVALEDCSSLFSSSGGPVADSRKTKSRRKT